MKVTKAELVADLMTLELKKKIKINDNIIIEDESLMGLHKTEAFVL